MTENRLLFNDIRIHYKACNQLKTLRVKLLRMGTFLHFCN
jgi:hypothetical protein